METTKTVASTRNTACSRGLPPRQQRTVLCAPVPAAALPGDQALQRKADTLLKRPATLLRHPAKHVIGLSRRISQ